MNHAELVANLQAGGVPLHILQDLPDLPIDADGLLIYGSRARGDAVPSSDLDMLALVRIPRTSTYSGVVNVSYYTREQLSTGIGTLFGAHLRRDSKIIWDRHGTLTEAIHLMGDVDTARLLSRARGMCELFTNLERDIPKYLPGLARQARYLLRSCLYARAIADGEPCFSVRELAVRHNDPALAELLASRQQREVSIDELYECLSRLRLILSGFPQSRHGSLEATIVNCWGEHSDVLSMAFMALGATGNGSDYAEVEKILL
ncbi:nucleotidyltransferase domain-containing protein [Nakamurella sp.]|uniref:nucleotidyltransferase domain-containing protein n=1 Tax=Nakamurella sp. TaxID=1869182 RepID=UPI003B3B6985